MSDLVLSAEDRYLFAGEVHSVVRYDTVRREAEAAYEILPHELDHLLPCYFGGAQFQSTW